MVESNVGTGKTTRRGCGKVCVWLEFVGVELSGWEPDLVVNDWERDKDNLVWISHGECVVSNQSTPPCASNVDLANSNAMVVLPERD